MPNGHILYVISRYTYRSTFIVREIAELAARGWTITVVSLRRPLFAPGTGRGRSAICGRLRRLSLRTRLGRRNQNPRHRTRRDLRIRQLDGLDLRHGPRLAPAQPRDRPQGLLLREAGSARGMPPHSRALGDGIDLGGDADLAHLRRAVFLHRPRLGHLLRHEAPLGESRCGPVRPHLHRLQSAAPGGDGGDRPEQGPRRLPRTAHSAPRGE